MASRRMLNTDLIKSDRFCALPTQAQALYLHLNLEADDDGLVGRTSALMRSLRIQKKFLTMLEEQGYIICFDSGIVAITHWHLHNKIRESRYTQTQYTDEISKLEIDEKSLYVLRKIPEASEFSCIQNVDSLSSQCRKGNVSIEKESLEEVSEVNVSSCAGEKLSSEYSDRLSYTEKQKYRHFINQVNLYFMQQYSTIDTEEFIKYNEQRCWRGKRGESVRDNYKQYIDAWMSRDYSQI
ncbi:MAG: hypothetical protein IJX92_02685 [Clostridia bacterium]|nr:hypothetical protein [Clostridia bacterium]